MRINEIINSGVVGVTEGSDLDAQAMDIATKLTTGKNLEKLRGMARDSTVYRALDRYFAKHNIPETIYNRVASIVFKRINQQGVAEGSTQKYEMMLRNGQVKRFVAKDDADAKRIAAGHGAKSVIRMKGNVPGDKIGEQGVAEGVDDGAKVYPLKSLYGGGSIKIQETEDNNGNTKSYKVEYQDNEKTQIKFENTGSEKTWHDRSGKSAVHPKMSDEQILEDFSKAVVKNMLRHINKNIPTDDERTLRLIKMKNIKENTEQNELISDIKNELKPAFDHWRRIISNLAPINEDKMNGDTGENYKQQQNEILQPYNKRVEELTDAQLQKELEQRDMLHLRNSRNSHTQQIIRDMRREAERKIRDKLRPDVEKEIADLRTRMPNGYEQYKQMKKAELDSGLAKGYGDFGRGDN